MKIELTEFELKLDKSLGSYDVHRWEKEKDGDEIKAQLQNVAALTELLLTRNAIPNNRLSYFTDAAYYVSSTKKSRKENFESNMPKDSNMFENPHFVKYLHYFIYGPKLPQTIIDSFIRLKEDLMYGDDVAEKGYLILARYIRTNTNTVAMHIAEESLKMMSELGFSIRECLALRNKGIKVR